MQRAGRARTHILHAFTVVVRPLTNRQAGEDKGGGWFMGTTFTGIDGVLRACRLLQGQNLISMH